MKAVPLPPFAPVLMESTRAIGYSVESAIADLIDNSISAGITNASTTDIGIWYLPYDEPYVAILDNGIGMTHERLIESMRYGSNSPLNRRAENDLGRYGLGMKTASLSQCRCLTVVSKCGGKINAARWDLDYIIDVGDWSLLELDENEIEKLPIADKLQKQESGTLILWNRLDKIKSGEITLEQALGNHMEDVRNHLSLVFHRYLSGDGVKKVTIKTNGNNINPFDPFFSSKSTLVMEDEIIGIPGNSGKVTVRPYILPHPSKMTKAELEKYGGKDGFRRLQGFYIYRNKRLLTWGTWFRLIKMDEFTKLARVRVDIPNSLDDLWTLDIKKSTAYPPEVVRIRLKQIIGTISNGSRKVWGFRKHKEIDKNVSHLWDRTETREGVRYFLNQDFPLLLSLQERIDGTSQELLRIYLETIQNNLPINALYCDIHNDVKIMQDQESVEKLRVCEMAKYLMEKAEEKSNIDQVYSDFEKVEPFCEYLNEIKEIYEEIKSDD